MDKSRFYQTSLFYGCVFQRKKFAPSERVEYTGASMNPEIKEAKEEMGENKTGSMREFVVETLKFAILAAVIVLPIRLFVAQPFIVKGQSMDPTFEDGQYLIVDEISYYTGEPIRGEVIIFKYPKDPSKYFIKRIIGLPGETVEIRNGKVSIRNTENPNGFAPDESYVLNTSGENFSMTLGEGEYFVMGDNRKNSLDSRAWGALPRENIVGRALVRLLPVDEIMLFPGDIRDIQEGI